jgi:phage recombination protein Bet
MSALITLTNKLSLALGIGQDTGELLGTLKATAFRGNVSDAQMIALMVVANQYKLNPWTKEIYAFPDRNNGIVPVVGVDGWSRIINDHPQFDGMEFEQNESQCTCIIYRKDRTRPIKVTEYMAECRRAETGPWKSHPMRMLRHKAMIQCARIAFGYGGIYDQDEASVIAQTINPDTGEISEAKVPTGRPELEAYPQDRFGENLPKWRGLIESGRKTAAEVIDMLLSKSLLSEEQKSAIRDLEIVDVVEIKKD